MSDLKLPDQTDEVKLQFCSSHHDPLLLPPQVKVVLRVNPAQSEGQGQPSALRVEPFKNRVTILEPISRSQSHAIMTLDRDGKHLVKTFNFDAAFPQESSQVGLFV